MNQKDINRQDFVDNQIYTLINDLNPSKDQIEWDIELIGEVRDAIEDILVDKLNICEEYEFYP